MFFLEYLSYYASCVSYEDVKTQQFQRAEAKWIGGCQGTVQGAQRYSLNLNFSFLNQISLLVTSSSYSFVLMRLIGPNSTQASGFEGSDSANYTTVVDDEHSWPMKFNSCRFSSQWQNMWLKFNMSLIFVLNFLVYYVLFCVCNFDSFFMFWITADSLGGLQVSLPECQHRHGLFV